MGKYYIFCALPNDYPTLVIGTLENAKLNLALPPRFVT